MRSIPALRAAEPQEKVLAAAPRMRSSPALRAAEPQEKALAAGAKEH